MARLTQPIRQLAITLLALSVAACANQQPNEIINGGASIKAGMDLVVQQRLLVPGYNTYAYIQGGESVHSNNVYRYDPYCRIELETVAQQPRYAEPGRFRILRIELGTELVLNHPLQLASARDIAMASATAEEYHTRLYVHSDSQPEVEMLFCSHWEDPTGFAEHLSAQQVRNTLQSVITFEEARQ